MKWVLWTLLDPPAILQREQREQRNSKLASCLARHPWNIVPSRVQCPWPTTRRWQVSTTNGVDMGCDQGTYYMGGLLHFRHWDLVSEERRRTERPFFKFAICFTVSPISKS